MPHARNAVGSETNVVIDVPRKNAIEISLGKRCGSRNRRLDERSRSRFISLSETDLDSDCTERVHYEMSLAHRCLRSR